MHRKTVKLSIALMTAFVIAGLGLIGCKKAAQAAESARPNVPDGYVLVEEDVLLQFVELPGEHFHKARENFLKKDLKGAASEIRKGEAFLRLQAARATAEGKKGLIASVAELGMLASDLVECATTSTKTLDRVCQNAPRPFKAPLHQSPGLQSQEDMRRNLGIRWRRHTLKNSRITHSLDFPHLILVR